MSKKPNQVPFTLGKPNIELLDKAYKKFGCKSRSELLKTIVEQWLFTNRLLILMQNEEPKQKGTKKKTS